MAELKFWAVNDPIEGIVEMRPQEVEAWIIIMYDKQHPIRTLRRWSNEECAAIEVYKIQDVYPEREPYQVYEGYSLRIEGCEVIRTHSLVVTPLSAAKVTAKEAAKRCRKEHIEKGIFINNVHIDTSLQGRLALQGMFQLADKTGPARTFCYKDMRGQWRSITSSQVEIFTRRVNAFIQRCFDYEMYLSESIDMAQDVDALKSIDMETGWPEMV